MAARFYGPYQVLSKVGPVAYKLLLPSHSKIHPVFHVSLLKKALQPHQQPQPLPPMLNEEYELQVEPADIVNWREDQQGLVEVLVLWKNLPTYESTWESAAKLQELFPTFPLEDKKLEPKQITINSNLLGAVRRLGRNRIGWTDS
ncbi:uncharacterized protein [Cicer arietinum]|uniref:uncharacterized protein n=1 Tax=Cicer arietinum TaxID=3827 RepID=UPI003CC580F1